MCQGLNSHYFHIIGDKLINPIVGVYIPIIRIPIKGGMTIPNIATLLTMAHMSISAIVRAWDGCSDVYTFWGALERQLCANRCILERVGHGEIKAGQKEKEKGCYQRGSLAILVNVHVFFCIFLYILYIRILHIISLILFLCFSKIFRLRVPELIRIWNARKICSRNQWIMHAVEQQTLHPSTS